MCAVFEHVRTIDENVLHADRKLVRQFKRGFIGNRLRIKDNDIGKIAALEQTAPLQAQIRRRQASQPAHGFGQR